MKQILARHFAACAAVILTMILRVAAADAQVNGASTPTPPTGQPAAAAATRVADLHRLLSEQWEYTMRQYPEFASILGDRRYNDRLQDYSQAAIERDLRQTRDFLRRFEAIDTSGFAVQEKLNRDLMVRDLREAVEAERFREWEMPVTQFGGLHIDLPQLVTSLPFPTVKDYDDYAARLDQVPRVFREITVQMRRGMADGPMPPRILLVQARQQAREALGDRFDIRAFHDEVLGAGALPIDTFEQRMAAWVTRVKAAAR
jgi:uncharacterized protein (DUF885 family)